MDSSQILDEVVTDELTTSEKLLTSIAENTRMTSVGISYIYVTGVVILFALLVAVIVKRWYFNYI